MVDPKITYKEREQLVLNNHNINELKKEISSLEKRKNKIKKSKLSELVSNRKIEISDGSSKQSQLINLLLRNGYIDENYLDYISIFYEGSLAKVDYQFLINVKIQETSEFDYRLAKIENLIKKISLYDFEKPYVLNFDLVEFIQNSKYFSGKKSRLFEQLANESHLSVLFVNRFVDTTKEIGVFIRNICMHWHNIFVWIQNKSLYSDDRREKYFTFILQYADLDDVVNIFENHLDYINSRNDFLQIVDDSNRIKELIKALNLKFKSLNSDSPKDLIEFVYQGNYYGINKETIELFLKTTEKYSTEKFNTKNYSAIQKSGLFKLIDYIETNLNEYVKNLYLKIETNISEPEEYLIKLFDSELISLELKEKLIEKVETKIETISLVRSVEVWNVLFRCSKVHATWENILISFQQGENSLNNDVISFLNTNAKELSKYQMPAEGEDKDGYNELCENIIYNGEINNTSYGLVTISVPWLYSNLNFDDIIEKRVLLLIENGVINPSAENYNSLKEHYKRAHDLLFEKNQYLIIREVEELEIDASDLEFILKSKKITLNQKNKILENCDEEIIHANPEVLKTLAELYLQNEPVEVQLPTFKKILLSNSITRDNRSKIFHDKYTLFTETFIESFLENLGGLYNKITYHSKKATLPDTSMNRQLLIDLINMEYISSFSEIPKGLRVNHKRRY